MSTRYAGDLAGLGARLQGELITRNDPGYGEASTAWNLSYRHRPSLIVRAHSVDDVVAAVHHARRHGLTISMQTTGHGVGSVVNEGVLILTGRLDRVTVDPSRATAVVEGGATWFPVLEASQEFGLAPLVGSSPHTGAVGYTLGGGFGWLGRRFGMAADHVRSFTVVLSDGSVVVASDRSEPELFWALCGAGMGSLGVVVEMEMGLVPVSTVYGGGLFYPVEMATEVFEFYASWSESLSVDFTSAFALSRPSTSRAGANSTADTAFAVIRGCHCGDQEDAAASVDRIRSWRKPELDTFRSMAFRDVGTISEDPVDPLASLTSARWITGLGSEVIAEMRDMVLGGDELSPFALAEARHGGGAMIGIRRGASYSPPEADRLLHVFAVTPTGPTRTAAKRRVETMWSRLAASVDSVFLNLNEGDERLEQSRNAFDFATWDRLAAISRQFDPGGLFAHGIDLRNDTPPTDTTQRKRKQHE